MRSFGDAAGKGASRLAGAIQFYRLGPHDARRMAALEELCFALPWSGEQCASALEQKAFRAFGAWEGDELVGYISLYCLAPELEILNLAVHPGKRRQGTGRRLLELVLHYGYKMGMQRAVLEVRESNRAALALYRRCGFAQCGERRQYYPDTAENALIFCKNI